MLFTIEIADFGTCFECGIPIAGSESFRKARARDHKSFYCLNGHSQYFPGKSDIKRERQKRELAERERDNARRYLKSEEARALDPHKETDHERRLPVAVTARFQTTR